MDLQVPGKLVPALIEVLQGELPEESFVTLSAFQRNVQASLAGTRSACVNACARRIYP